MTDYEKFIFINDKKELVLDQNVSALNMVFFLKDLKPDEITNIKNLILQWRQAKINAQFSGVKVNTENLVIPLRTNEGLTYMIDASEMHYDDPLIYFKDSKNFIRLTSKPNDFISFLARSKNDPSLFSWFISAMNLIESNVAYILSVETKFDTK